MKKPKYTFNHFMVIDGLKKEIDPRVQSNIADRCKLEWAYVTTGNEYVLADGDQNIERGETNEGNGGR